MKRFCQECGHEAKMSDKMCTNCGTKLIEIQQPEQTQATTSQSQTRTNAPAKPHKAKKPMSKQQKIIIGAVGALAVLLIGFSIWANMYFSKDSTENRFYKAIENEDAGQLEKLLMHENGSAATKSEVEAFLKLAKTLKKNELEDFISVEKEGKFIGIFEMHKVEAVDQYAYYYGPTDGLAMKFNKTEVKDKKDSEGIKYGPLLPGIYTVNVSLDNNFGKSTTDIELELANLYSGEVWMDELPIGEASVYVMNYDSYVMEDSYLLVNDHKVEIDEYGDSDYFGPIFLDGSQKVKVVVNYPWGEVESEEYPLESSYIEVDAAFVTEAALEEIKDTLLTFGEEMQNAKAQLSTDVFTSATDVLKEDFLYYEIDPLVQENLFYTGMLNKVDINEEATWFYDGLLMIHTMFDYSYAFFEAGEDLPALEDYELHSYVGLAFDETAKEWKVSYIEMSNHEAVEATATLEGSGKVYEPSANAVTAMATNALRAELQEFMEIYSYASINAINYGDISYMSPYLSASGPRYKEAKDYIAYLVNEGITEEFISTQVVDIVDNGNGTYNVKTVDEVIIYYPDSESFKTFETVSEVINENGSWKVNKLISTTEM
ncbi:Membrane protein YvbJ OS=Ureibacillus acetophenoni OX=614649 GN=SAMN05877842_104108 PE=4 SV=1 [Ureibacillus acetophenoni]